MVIVSDCHHEEAAQNVDDSWISLIVLQLLMMYQDFYG